MEEGKKIMPTHLENICVLHRIRLCKCWNILRTLSDKELESLEKQTDLVIKEHGEEFVAVHVGPSLPF